MNKENNQKLNQELARYIRQGVWQDFTKYIIIKYVMIFCGSLMVFLTILIAYAEYKDKNLHFVKEFARYLMQIFFAIITYFIGRRQERDKIKNIASVYENCDQEKDGLT